MNVAIASVRAGEQMHRSLTYLRHHLVTLSVTGAALVAWVVWYPHRPPGITGGPAPLALGVGVILLGAGGWLLWRSQRLRRGLGGAGLAATGTLVAVSVVFAIGAAVELVAVVKGIAPQGLHHTMLVTDVVLAAAAAFASRLLTGGEDG
ncbi:MAG: hypothetical protein ACR2K3_13215 [Nocardioides sp.]